MAFPMVFLSFYAEIRGFRLRVPRGQVSLEDFMAGCQRLKGPAKSPGAQLRSFVDGKSIGKYGKS